MDYQEIWNKMEWNKVYTARELLVAPASLAAMKRRGLVEIIEGKPKKYIKIRNKYNEIYSFVDKVRNELENERRTEEEIVHIDISDMYFVAWTKGAELGMFCRIKNSAVVDCYDKVYNTNDIVRVVCNGREFNFNE